MGRYSSVQAVSDQQNTRTTTYEQEKASSSTVVTEKVHNPYGSTAGAGSGEFHIYRHARAREMERLKALEKTEEEKIEDEKFQSKIEEWKSEEEKRLSKKRKKRQREKAAKMRKKNLSLSGVNLGNGNQEEDEFDDDEFEYTPLYQKDDKEGTSEYAKGSNVREGDAAGEKVSANDNVNKEDGTKQKEYVSEPPLPFKNDGSFMEMMMKKMQEENQASSK